MKRCSTSLAVRKMQIKTTKKYHFTTVRMAIINETNSNKYWRGVEKKEFLLTAGGNVTGTATMENSMDFPLKIKNRITR